MAVQIKQDGGKSGRQIYTILIVCLNTITTGELLGWTSPVIPQLLQKGITMSQASTITIITPITTIFGSLFFGKIMDLVGRRPALLSITIPYVISWLLISTADHMLDSHNTSSLTINPLYIYYCSRVLNGIGDAGAFSCIPCYVTEIATPKIRGTWGNCMSLSMFLGQFLINVIGTYFSISNAAYISLIIPVIFLGNFFYLKESPYYLIMKGRVDEARTCLQWLRSSDNVESELVQLISDVNRQLSETGRWLNLIQIKSNRKACLIGIVVRAAQQFSGISAFSVFAQTIFLESGSNLSPGMSAIMFTAMLVMCCFVGSFFLDYFGKRTAMLISCTGTCLVLSVQTAFFYIQDETDIPMDGFQVFTLVSMIIFVAVYSIGLGLVPTLILGELFSSSIKSKALALMNVFFGISLATSAKIFAEILTQAGMYAAFLFLAVCSAISIVVSYCIVPETKGKTLEEIQQDLKK